MPGNGATRVADDAIGLLRTSAEGGGMPARDLALMVVRLQGALGMTRMLLANAMESQV